MNVDFGRIESHRLFRCTADLILPAPAEGSAEVARRVAAARTIQAERYAAVGLAGVSTNAAAPTRAIEELAAADSGAQALVREAAERFALSARGYHRVLKLARTIADLDGSSAVRRAHLAEALAYRTGMDRSAHAAA